MLTYIDAHPAYEGPHRYIVTNEEPELLNQALGPRTFGKVGGIASAGEVLLGVLMPRAKGPITVVDHSRKSLAVCAGKLALLTRLGPKGLKALMTDGTVKDVATALRGVSEEIPAELREVRRPYGSDPAYVVSGGDVSDRDLRKVWWSIPVASLEAAHRRLGDVTLVHGDLTDLAPYGPFGCVYISNAFEHHDRTGKKPMALAPIAPLLRKRGSVLLVSDYHKPIAEGFVERASIKGVRTMWNHRLLQMAPPPRQAITEGA